MVAKRVLLPTVRGKFFGRKRAWRADVSRILNIAPTDAHHTMENVPDHLRIKVIYKDEAIVLIDKPCNLRSVPGHANPPPTAAHLTRANSEKENRFTCQETWTQAILSFNNDEADDTASKWLSALSRTPNPSSIPRKWSPFRRYVHRNQRRLNQMDESDKVKPLPKQTIDDTKIDEIVNEMYERIRKRQVPLMNLPEATSHEESAFGQLILLGYGNDNESGKPNCRRNHMGLYVVHRLDCEVSRVGFDGFQVLFIYLDAGADIRINSSLQVDVRNYGVC